MRVCVFLCILCLWGRVVLWCVMFFERASVCGTRLYAFWFHSGACARRLADWRSSAAANAACDGRCRCCCCCCHCRVAVLRIFSVCTRHTHARSHIKHIHTLSHTHSGRQTDTQALGHIIIIINIIVIIIVVRNNISRNSSVWCCCSLHTHTHILYGCVYYFVLGGMSFLSFTHTQTHSTHLQYLLIHTVCMCVCMFDSFTDAQLKCFDAYIGVFV